jgi:hypothetical protein
MFQNIGSQIQGIMQNALRIRHEEKIQMKANSVAKTLQRIRDQLRDCIQRKTKAEFRL